MADEEVQGLRKALRSGLPLVGTFVMLPRPEVVEMLAAAGFDAAVFDLEHGPITTSDLSALAAAAQGVGLFAIARLAEARPDEIARALDAGVDGVILPHVSSAEAARAVVAAGRFPPLGERSLNAFVRGLHYGWPLLDGTAAANRRVALIAMVEGRGALEELDAIVGTDGLDGLFVGPMDLAAALGHPGQPDHPEVRAAIGSVLATMLERGMPSAIYAPDAEFADRAIAQGVCLVALSTDVALSVRAFAAARSSVITKEMP